MNIVHDLLDVQLIDQRGRNIGRVDGLVMELRPGKPPRVTAMEVGTGVLAARLNHRIARWWSRWCGMVGASPEPSRIAMSTIRDIGVDVEVEIDPPTRASLLRFESWLRRQVVARIPGGR